MKRKKICFIWLIFTPKLLQIVTIKNRDVIFGSFTQKNGESKNGKLEKKVKKLQIKGYTFGASQVTCAKCTKYKNFLI